MSEPDRAGDQREPAATGGPSISPIPLTVIGGYLGAGKTTLLNRLLRRAGEGADAAAERLCLSV